MLDRKTSDLERYEYADALLTVLLAVELGKDSDVAIRRSCRRVRKRLKAKTIQRVMLFMAEQNNPTKYLQGRIDSIEEHMPMNEFITLGLSQMD